MNVRNHFYRSAALLGLCPIPGTLGAHVAHGDVFAYDPPGLAVTYIKGRFTDHDLGVGTIRWRETPASDSYLAETNVTGDVITSSYGTDVLSVVTVKEDNGTIRSTEVEESWQGCSLTQRARPLGGSNSQWLTHEGTWDGQVYHYAQERFTRTRGQKQLFYGQRQPDGSWSESYVYNGVGTDIDETWGGNVEGTTWVNWLINWGDAYIFGSDTMYLDGSRRRTIEEVFETCGDSYDFTIGYDGSGTGTSTRCEVVYPYPDDPEWYDIVYSNCTMKISNGACSRTCTDGGTYSCEYAMSSVVY
ncbi:hypothetical protein [Polyangium mundeleinium]|uniref:Uncharacterized protein n=1 Tax=Polyangium mundeleinium TaxID=2995306 RepID=A0ABT5EHP9_9BACT|nr:hypothetical protein [Polyangium mundeleinium]MDC0741361.1 hypothetical protein [Polyangium mundeleinium]